MVYVLQVKINRKKYYVTDLSGSLSRNPVDCMLFFDEFSAGSYAGPDNQRCQVTGIWRCSENSVRVYIVPLRLLSMLQGWIDMFRS